MDMWNQVEVVYGSDETAVFGPRHELGTAPLYQVDTVAIINSEGEVSERPKVNSAVAENLMCIAVSHHLHVFQKEGQELSYTTEFEGQIEQVSCTDNGLIIAVGDSTGRLTFLSAKRQKPLLSHLVASPSNYSSVFCNLAFVSDSGRCQLLVLLTSGRLICFDNLSFSSINEVVESGGTEKLAQLQAEIIKRVVETKNLHSLKSYWVSALQCVSNSSVLTCGSGESSICMWDKNDENSLDLMWDISGELLGNKLGFLKCMPVAGETCILCLDYNHLLTLFCSQTLLILQKWEDHKVVDFLPLEGPPCENNNNTSNNLANSKVVLLTAPEHGKCSLLVCSFGISKPIYSLELSADSHLAKGPPGLSSITLVEGITTDNSLLTGTLRLRYLTEALPETRFYRLLHKQQFEEAENFANLFGQDVNLVFKSKFSYLLELLSPWRKERLSSKEINDCLDDLKVLLLKITDNLPMLENCVNSALVTYEATQDMLVHARNLAKQHIDKPDLQHQMKGEYENIYRKAQSCIHRLETFRLVHGAEQFSGSEWERFFTAKLLENFVQLQQYDMGRANIIWNRHCHEFENDFDDEMVEEVLLAIPQQIEVVDVQAWLTDDFIPYLIKVNPSSLGHVATWLENRARAMEITHKDGWPQNALDVCCLLQSACVAVSDSASDRGYTTPLEFSTQLAGLSVTYSHMQGATRTDNNPFVRLQALIQDLRHLIDLHKKYKCRLALDEYVKETTESITYRMLDRVMALELIPSIIESTIRPYMREHNLAEDKLLFQYIGDLAQRSGNSWSSFGEALWEAKAITVISCINNTDFKCRAILDAMARANIPLSEEMESLVQEGLKLKHPRVSEIEQKYILIEKRKLLLEYDLRGYNVYEALNSYSYAEDIILRIISCDKKTSLQDALKVAEVFGQVAIDEVYNIRLGFLIENDQVETAIALLKTLSHEKAVKYSKCLVEGTKIILSCAAVEQPYWVPGELEIYRDMRLKQVPGTSQVVKYLLRHHSDSFDTHEREELENTCNILSSISGLQTEFQEFFSFPDRCDVNCCKALLQIYLKKWFNAKQSNDIPDSKEGQSNECRIVWTKIKRLASLLDITPETLSGEVLVLALETGQVEIALEKAKELHELDTTVEGSTILYKIAHSLVIRLTEPTDGGTKVYNYKVVSAIQDLINKALIKCPSELIPDYLQLSRSVALAQDAFEQCREDEGSLAFVKKDYIDEYRALGLGGFLKEDSLVMDPEEIGPMLYEFAATVLPEASKPKYPYQQKRLQGIIPSLTTQVKDEAQVDISSQVSKLVNCSSRLVQYLRSNSQLQLALQFTLASTEVVVQCWMKQKKKAGTDDLNKDLMTVSAGAGLTSDLASGLLVKVFSQSHVDHDLALGYLHMLPGSLAMERMKKMLKSAGQHYKRVLAMARVGWDYATLTGQLPSINKCDILTKEASWGITLAKKGISFKEAFQKSSSLKKDLLPELMRNPEITYDVIAEYCNEFGLVEGEALLLYIKEKLTAPSMPGEITKQQLMAAAEGNVQKAIYAVNLSDCPKGILNEELAKLFQSLSPYDYESCHFVLEQQSKIDETPAVEKALGLLILLEKYQRIAPPQEYEENYLTTSSFSQLVLGTCDLSPLSALRLPLHVLLFGEAWKVLSPELNKTTIATLLPISAVLGLPTDQVYLITIQNLVKEHVRMKQNTTGAPAKKTADKSKCNWVLEDQADMQLLEAVQQLLLGIVSMENAVMCAHWVVQELPMGAEKVAALTNCCELSKKWLQAAPDTAEKKRAQEAFTKLSSILKQLSTEQVLFQNGLGESELLSLCNRAPDLIMKLYEHPAIPKLISGGTRPGFAPDIHKVTDELAKINRVDINKVRLHLVERWLPCVHAKQDDLDMTLSFDLKALSTEDQGPTEEEINQDSINLKRVTYLLQIGTLSNNAIFLLTYTFKKEDSRITPLCRTRALRCLFSLIDSECIAETCGGPVEAVQQRMRTLLYLVEMEGLRIPQSVVEFEKCSKEGLVRGIWRNHSNQVKALQLISDICLDFDLNDINLWNSVLHQMMKLGMREYLLHLLMCLSSKPHLWQIQCMRALWHYVLLDPLEEMAAPLTDDQMSSCLSSLSLLQRCPLLSDLDMTGFSKQLVRLGMSSAALGCLLLLPPNNARDQAVSCILQQESPSQLLTQVDKWQGTSSPFALLTHVKDTVLDYVEENGIYSQLDMAQLQRLGSRLVSKGQIDNLLQYGMERRQNAYASHLLQSYMKLHHQGSSLAKDIGFPWDEPTKQLERYLMHLAEKNNSLLQNGHGEKE